MNVQSLHVCLAVLMLKCIVAESFTIPITVSTEDLSPFVSPLNADYDVSCKLKPKSAKCGVDVDNAETTMCKSSWWACQGTASACFSRAIVDIQANLAECGCTNNDQISNDQLPVHLKTLAELAQLIGDDVTDGSFSSQMELVANVAVQKSRYCVFDIAAFSRLTNMMQTCTEIVDSSKSGPAASTVVLPTIPSLSQ